MNTSYAYAEAAKEISIIKEIAPESRPVFDCFNQILKAQNETLGNLSPVTFTPGQIDAFGERIKAGTPALTIEDIRIEWEAYDGLLGRIREVVKVYAPEIGASKEWPEWTVSDATWKDSLLSGFLEEGTTLSQAAEMAGVALEPFVFLSGQALIPFLEKHAEAIRDKVDDALWTAGFCPVCGSEPVMGRLEKEAGQKRLTCYLCRTEWVFSRLECAFCGNKEQDKLRYFEPEEESPYLVEVCDACKSYLKLVDQRKAAETRTMISENLATLHLDLIASKEGFARDTNRLFGM